MREMTAGVDTKWRASTITNVACIIVIISILQLSIGLYTYKLLKTKFQIEIHERIKLEKENILQSVYKTEEETRRTEDSTNFFDTQMFLYQRRILEEQATQRLCKVVHESCVSHNDEINPSGSPRVPGYRDHH